MKLEAPREVLLQRVVQPERKALKKLSRPERLLRLLDEEGALEAIPYVESLVLDTAQLSPQAAAQTIVQHYGLARG